jgi:hypothetical protein
MRRLNNGRVAMVLGLLWLVAGCGTAGTYAQGQDGLTMAFSGFDGVGIVQADFVTDTAAQVDVCEGLCRNGDIFIDDGTVVEGEITREEFTSTFVNALFTNRGKADIVLDSYTLNVADSGVPGATRRISARLPGGRCDGGDPQRQCSDHIDCGGLGTCAHTTTPVTILLYDFDFKTRGQQGTCPFDIQDITLNADLTFTGSDESGQRFTVNTNYVSTFANFVNCDDE